MPSLKFGLAENVLRAEPQTLSLKGCESARKGWLGGPVSTAATHCDQHPSQFRLFAVYEPNC